MALETISSAKGALNPDPRLGTFKRHLLKDEHPLSETHVLVEHTNDERGDGNSPMIPRIMGSHIPREKSGCRWELFALAHFKPFGPSVPLVNPGMTVEQTYKNFKFSPRSRFVMNNWEAVHECQDERDAERLRKRAALTSQSMAMTHAINNTMNPADPDEVDVSPTISRSTEAEFKIMQTIRTLEQSQWLSPQPKNIGISNDPARLSAKISHKFPEPTARKLKEWMQDMKRQESLIAHARRNTQESPHVSTEAAKTEQGSVVQHKHDTNLDCPPTDSMVVDSLDDRLSPEDVIDNVGNDFCLNENQWTAFQIIARSFVRRYVEGIETDTEPLRMLMTGPGGTGKTHVVKAVQKVMDHYGCAHKIRFLAPTGSAAALIDGMTIHKGLGIKVKSKEKGKGNRKLGDHKEDYSVIISVQNRTMLRDEWRDVVVLLVDECSLVGCELMSELDFALRFAKEKPDEWFGGIMVIFAGDFYQYPPVGGTALYTPISAYSGQSNEEISKRLGRMAWKAVNSVVTLTEQERMKQDPEYGAAVRRLRVRECTLEDVELFNSRVIKSATNEEGIDMSIPTNFSAAAIVRTNLLRETLNHRKAQANSAKTNEPLIVCAALDKCATRDLTRRDREQLLNLNLTSSKLQNALPGFVPLYVGMPVVLRMKNISTDLGITNGSQGIVRQIYTSICPVGLTYCTCAIVEFPDCKISLPGLPKGYFPIVPSKWTFTTLLTMEDGTQVTIQLTRYQLPVQPGFAVTGQSAQGKTLPSVLANLHEGGFGAYVAASRA